MNRLAGKHVLTTGASAGIGAACTRQFAERGAHVDIFNLVMMPTAQRYPGYMDRD